MVDYDTDGLGEGLDLTVKVVGMEAARVAEAIGRALAERRRQEAQASADRARDYRAWYESQVALARHELMPVMREDWWRDADQSAIRDKYVTAVAFARQDARFIPFQERLEERAADLHGLTPEAIMRGPVTREPRVVAPLDMDGARLLAATTAPGWYRLQDQVATDLPPALRERTEARLLEDMTQLRSTGHLDTDSAKLEWGRFTGHPMATAEQDENESLGAFQDRRREALAVHWAATEPDRDRVSEPHGQHVGKPMSVEEAEEFMGRYAPDWLVDRHQALMDQAAQNDDPDRALWEQTSHREQLRYAMETARDTGSLGHPYAQALRSQAAMLGVDETESMHNVPAAERVAFGGPAARPMTEAEAMEMMAGYAPTWYQDQVRRTMREGTMIGEAGRRIEADAVRADMTVLRDRGVLASDHAQRLWAVSQPGYDPEDMSTWKGVERRAQLWAETAETREGPRPMDPNNRERFGGTRELDTQPIPVVTAAREERGEAEDARRAVEDPVAWSEETLARMDREDAEDTRRAVEEPFQWRDAALAEMDRDEERIRRHTQTPREEPREAPVGDWPTRAPGQPAEARTAPPAGEPPAAPQGPAWDTPERRRRDAERAIAAGMPVEAVASRTAVDYGRATPPGKTSGGKPPQFQEWVDNAARAAARAREAGKKDPQREQ